MLTWVTFLKADLEVTIQEKVMYWDMFPGEQKDKGIQGRKAEEAKPGSDFRQHAAFARSQREALEKKLHPRIDPDLSIEN